MLFCVSKRIFAILPMLVVGAVSLSVSAVLIFSAVKMLKRQIKLYNSIRLVELKSSKVRYWAFILIVAFCIFYLTTQIFDPEAPEKVLLTERFAMQAWQYNLTLSLCLILLVSAELFFLMLAFSRSAVVDKGVYTEFRYFDWYHIHDYVIDEDRGVVILSGNKNTFRTIDTTTPPMRVAQNDVPKLKFILNKNKNKFSADG